MADLDLHNAIMNIPCHPYRDSEEFVIGYKFGHRDARHAAAELALAFSKTSLDYFIEDVEAAEGWLQPMESAQPKYPDEDLISKMVNEAKVAVQDAADAARYRHLVATCNVDFDPSEPWQLVIREPDTGEDWKAKLDSAIDEAMKGEQP